MNKINNTKIGFISLAVAVTQLLSGCGANKDNVLAVTGTVIGVQIHEKDTDKTPELKVGYARSEVAYVPTDKSSKDAPHDGADKTAEVLMEINAQGNVALGTAYQGAVYQRLAVGKKAVSQPGAAFMMAKNSEGELKDQTASKISNAIVQSAAEVVTNENEEAKILASATDDGHGNVDGAKLYKLVKGTLIEGRVSYFYGKPISELENKLKGGWRLYIEEMILNNK
ncbi:hypothetical protein JCM14076_28780 [Methylosoma difficile]